ncbi:MAG: Holliday junction branch migration protein RuvA [SAR324 cluster bacterium]|nr:Holliday junction branch migration protein RuvA [SAR324 cluster bacterium]
MIGWLKGQLLAVENDEVLLQAGQVGYWVTLGPAKRMALGLKTGSEAALFIYTVVREDDLKLFGFETLESRKLFTHLTSVNGVGPKAGMGILDALSPQEILLAIQSQDVTPFTRVSGVGKKTAARILLDLAGKLDSLETNYMNQTTSTSADSSTEKTEIEGELTLRLEARSALVNLGFADKDADKVIQSQIKPNISLNELITRSLSQLKR